MSGPSVRSGFIAAPLIGLAKGPSSAMLRPGAIAQTSSKHWLRPHCERPGRSPFAANRYAATAYPVRSCTTYAMISESGKKNRLRTKYPKKLCPLRPANRAAKPDDDSDDAQSPPQHVNLRCTRLIDSIFG